MKVLVAATRLGPAAVFLPDGTHATAGSPELTEPLLTEAAAGGTGASWLEHAQRLAAGPVYAGRWSLADVPDGITAVEALHRVRYAEAKKILSTG